MVWPYGQADGQWESALGIALWKSLWEFKGHIKVGGMGEGTGEVIRWEQWKGY